MAYGTGTDTQKAINIVLFILALWERKRNEKNLYEVEPTTKGKVNRKKDCKQRRSFSGSDDEQKRDTKTEEAYRRWIDKNNEEIQSGKENPKNPTEE